MKHNETQKQRQKMKHISLFQLKVISKVCLIFFDWKLPHRDSDWFNMKCFTIFAFNKTSGFWHFELNQSDFSKLIHNQSNDKTFETVP